MTPSTHHRHYQSTPLHPPTFSIQGAKGYDIFNSKRPGEGCIKVVLKTSAAAAREAPKQEAAEAQAAGQEAAVA